LKKRRIEQKRRELEMKRIQEEKDLKRKVSEEKVNEWRAKKEGKSKKSTTKKNTRAKTAEVENIKRTSEECEMFIKKWLEKKKNEERIKKLFEEQKRTIDREFEIHRRNLAGVYYGRWLKTADQKDKPVPLNRGMESLRGSISNLFINPIPWQKVAIEY
jgi:coiled-coil domain-containing protein 34